MGLITLQAKQIKKTEHGFTGTETHFYKDNVLYCVFPLGYKQPNKNTKTININCWKWNVEWL